MCLSGKTSQPSWSQEIWFNIMAARWDFGADTLDSQILIIANLSCSHSYDRACICAPFLQSSVCLKGQACKSCCVTTQAECENVHEGKNYKLLYKVTAIFFCVCVLSGIQKLSVFVIFLVLSSKWLTYAALILYNIILLNLRSFGMPTHIYVKVHY